MHQGLAGLGPVTADVNQSFGRVFVLLEKNAVGDVLQVGEGLSLTPDEPAGILGLHVQEDAVFEIVLLDGGFESQMFQELVKDGFGLLWHNA